MKHVFSALSVLFWVGICIVLLLGLPWYTSARGIVVPAVVTRKDEAISVDYGDWSRRCSLVVTYQPRDTAGPEMTWIHVDTATFDHLHAGSTVQVKYLPNRTLRTLTLFAYTQLANRSPFLWLIDLATASTLRVVVVILGGIGVLLCWLVLRVRAAGLIFLAYVLAGVIYLFVLTPAPVAPVGQQATATVRGLYAVDRIMQGHESPGIAARQPYQIVELMFVPPGRTDPVVAVDMIDAGSVPGLQQGRSVPIRYPVNDPRQAQVVGAQRRYHWQNTLGALFWAGGGVLIFAVVMAVVELVRRAVARVIR